MKLKVPGTPAGSYGSATVVPTLTVDIFGRVTVAGTASITLAGLTVVPAGITLSGTGQILAPSGVNVSAPGYSFSGDAGTGFYHAVFGGVGFASGGVHKWSMAANGIIVHNTTNGNDATGAVHQITMLPGGNGEIIRGKAYGAGCSIGLIALGGTEASPAATTTSQICEYRQIGADTPWTTAQVETATAAGTIGTSGNVAVPVTGSGITGSPLTTQVAVTSGDTPTVWAGKVVTALQGVAAITSLYTVSGSGTSIILTRTSPGYAVYNDSTLNIALADNTSVGVTAAPTSANTTLGYTLFVGGRLMFQPTANWTTTNHETCLNIELIPPTSITRARYIGFTGVGTVIGDVAVTSPGASTVLHLVSTTRGFLAPIMTGTQVTAITATEGLMVNNSTTHYANRWNGTRWYQFEQSLATGQISGWTVPALAVGTAASNTVTITGAQVGDYVDVTPNFVVNGAAAVVGIVTSTNTVTVYVIPTVAYGSTQSASFNVRVRPV